MTDWLESQIKLSRPPKIPLSYTLLYSLPHISFELPPIIVEFTEQQITLYSPPFEFDLTESSIVLSDSFQESPPLTNSITEITGPSVSPKTKSEPFTSTASNV